MLKVVRVYSFNELVFSKKDKLRAASILVISFVFQPSMAARYELPSDGSSEVGVRQVVIARYEDTFADLAERYDLGYQEMLDANPGVDAWLPKVGTHIQIPTQFTLPDGPRDGVVINLAELRLYYFPAETRLVYTYPLGIGREGWDSPVATTRITEKVANPSWFPTPSIRAEHAANGDPLPSRVPPGPDNPLGPYKIRLGLPAYLIHGSNKKFGIGTRTSHGCFRMYNQDVAELFSKVPVGTKVRIINEVKASKTEYVGKELL
ncbi:putative L,D-transpeptidase YbiS [compost metagenome]